MEKKNICRKRTKRNNNLQHSEVMTGTGDVIELLRKCSLNILIQKIVGIRKPLIWFIDWDRILWKTLNLNTSLKDAAMVLPMRTAMLPAVFWMDWQYGC